MKNENFYEVTDGQSLHDQISKGKVVIVQNGQRIDSKNADFINTNDFGITNIISKNMADSMIDGAKNDKPNTVYMKYEPTGHADKIIEFMDNLEAFKNGKITLDGLHIKEKQFDGYMKNSSLDKTEDFNTEINKIKTFIDIGVDEKLNNIPQKEREGYTPSFDSSDKVRVNSNALNSSFIKVVERKSAAEINNRDNKAERTKEKPYVSMVEKYKEAKFKSNTFSEPKEMIKMGYTDGVAKSATIVVQKDPMLAKKVLTDTNVTQADIKKYARKETQIEADKHLFKKQQEQTQNIGVKR